MSPVFEPVENWQPAAGFDTLPPAPELLDWLRQIVPIEEWAPAGRYAIRPPEVRAMIWWRMLDRLHAQGKLNHIATPPDIEFVAALEAAIRHEVDVGLLTKGDQLAVIARLRDYTSPAAAKQAPITAKQRRVGEQSRKFTDDVETAIAQAFVALRPALPSDHQAHVRLSKQFGCSAKTIGRIIERRK